MSMGINTNQIDAMLAQLRSAAARTAPAAQPLINPVLR